ncbi:MAG: hypothetical protein NTX52_11585 [Planctomycetota bacterium]|nr:hypothetical protein [Planctomycetota bacterium]
MAFEPGGYADKLGNRYEGRWVVKQLLRMLNEEIHSLTIEAVGDDERGVDVVIVKNDGATQFQQCKARNASKESWDISDLNIRGILRNMQFQLDRNPSNEFALVTGVPASAFGDICESARNSNGNSEDFYLYQIQKVGETRRRIFRHFNEYLGLNPEQEQDREKAFRYLQKIHIILWPDDQNSRDELLGWAGVLINGEPDIVIGTLVEFAQNNIRKTLTAKNVRTHLSKLGLHPRELSHDSRVAPAIEKLQKTFEESIRPILIGGELIPRNETQQLLNALEKNKIVILHGARGIGKSGVLYELTQTLKEQGLPYLPLRLDRQQPTNTPRQFGDEIGLPDSPVLCLASLITGASGVLIIDQLDALRWTSSHSANSLDVCKAIVRETHRLQMMGKRISMVLSCRTFDLEHDPEIKRWLSDQEPHDEQYQKVEVKGLPLETIKTVIEKAGGDFGRLTEREKQILSSPQHIAMWVKLKRNTRMHEFRSATQLMREFWTEQYRELEALHVNAEEADTVLDDIVNYMEQNGKLFAPASLILHQQRVNTALSTQEIIRIDNNQVSFWHQSYLDFRIADRLLRDIHRKQDDICSWLGAKEKQSLFRREQLRQVLVLLSDEAPHEFMKNVRALLLNKDIRFHLKHLSLSVLGQIEQPIKEMLDFSAELLKDTYWRDHVIELIYWNSVPYIQSLVSRGIMQKWLESSDKTDIDLAIRLLRSINDKSGDLLADVLSPYLDKGADWLERILNALWFSPEKDSDKMFELRIELVRRGYTPQFIHWDALVKSMPLRAIKILEAAISTWDSPRMEENSLTKKRQRARFEHWTADDVKALSQDARKYPLDTWDMLMPHIERLTAIKLDKYDTQLNDWLEERVHGLHDGYTTLPRGIVLLVLEAGKELANNKANEFLLRTQSLQDSISPITREILLIVYAALPAEFSDEGIRWLLANHSRFAIGSGYSEPEWTPAAQLISALSPHCSDKLFHELEYSITHYHSPDEKDLAKYYLPKWKEGYFGDYWGRAQHFLLPALDKNRRSKDTEGLIGVLNRKFDKYPEWLFLSGGHISGGFICSPLPKDKLHKISDKDWLRIINNKNIPEEDHYHRYKQTGPETAAESSIRHFADDLRTIASRYPERFGQLALRFPEDVHPRYLAAILDGVKTTKPKDMTDEEKVSWEPARIETIEAILEKFQFGDDRNVATNFCWLIRERPDENWSDRAINKLLEYAKFHPDPNPGKLNMYPSSEGDDANKASVHTLLDNALNCVRGVSGLAIGALLWKHPDWLERLRPGIESLVKDSHPVVRVAAIEACLPVININKDLAVDWFVTACRDDIRVAALRYAVYYFNSCIKSHFEKLSPIILRMLDSEYDEVVEEGALEICARWLFFGMFHKELERCKTGNTAQRKGIAKIASQFLTQEKYTSKCRELLTPLLNDNEHEVRAKANRGFYNNKKILNVQGIKDFLIAYTKSKAFGDDPTGLLFTFEDYPGSLMPHSDIVFSICEAFAGHLAELSRNFATGTAHDASMICPLILRLYEQSKDNHPEIMNRCLDSWDEMFEHRIGIVSDLMKQLDQ